MRGVMVVVFACSGPAAPISKPAPIATPTPVPIDAMVAVQEQGCGPSKIATSEPRPDRIVGAVCDVQTHHWLSGVTVIATAPQLLGTQTAITDIDGAFAITKLPEGNYLVTYYYDDVTVETHAATAAKPFVFMLDTRVSGAPRR